jgi:hypothetical protein
MRMLIGARRPSASATSLSTSSSASLSTLKQAMPAASAWRISARVLPTPEKMIFFGSAPTASTRAQFAARDDVEAAAGFGEHAQHAERRIGLHRVADQRVAAFEAALVGGQRVQHPLLRIDEQRRAVFAGQRVERQPSTCSAPSRWAMCGWPGREALVTWRSAVPVAGCGRRAAGGGRLGCRFAGRSADESPGVISCGKVARWAAAGSFGRYSAPRWPQAARPVAPQRRQTMSTARPRALTRIWRTFNIAKL